MPVRYAYWVAGRVHEPVRQDARRQPADPPDLLRVMETHAPARHRRRDPGGAGGRPDRRATRRYASTAPSTTRRRPSASSGSRSRLLASADGPGPLRRRSTSDRSQHLPDRQPERRRPGKRAPTSSARSSTASRAPGDGLMIASIAHVLAVHARVDARGRQRRLRAHRARQGAERAHA